jgi:capsular polysaccharide synthesis protein
VNKRISKLKIIKDLSLNIIGSFIMTGITQIIIYPFLSNRLGTIAFGSLLTLIGLSNAIGVIFGSSLNNIRLLKQHKHEELGKKGDFRRLLLISQIFIAISIILISIIFKGQITVIESITLILVTIFTMYRVYMNVYYRIDLNYTYILLHMVITAIGYVIGIVLFSFISIWPIVFLCGEIAAFIFALLTTSFKNENYEKTLLYNETKKEFIQLALSNTMANLLLYLDRLIINPILGAANVSIYFVASIVGKTLGIVLQPLSSIILTYISKIEKVNKRKLFTAMVSVIIVFGGISYILSIPITPIITKVLYRDSYLQAKPFYNISNLSVILMIMGNLIQPMILKYCPIIWQSIVQGIYTITYVFLVIILMNKYGLMGFCIGAAIANLIRLIIFLVVGYINVFNIKIKSKRV